MDYDLIILGAGVAGLSSAVYASRRALKTLVISKDLGGQTALALNIENYPGFPKVDGIDFMKTLQQQAKTFGAEIKFEMVNKLTPKEDRFVISTTSGQEYMSKAVILAFGRTPRYLEVPGEKELTGKGVAYCATCDAPLFAGKDVAVVGGGNSAVNAALVLADIANKVYVIHRREEFRAEEIRINELKQSPKVEFVFNAVATEIKGDPLVSQLAIKDIKTGDVKELSVEGVFVEIGNVVNSDWLGNLLKLTDQGEIIIDDFNHTSQQGVFAAGDATEVPYKQMIIAAGEGAKAALAAYDYIKKRSSSH
ncbi:FAD-dependent oxidoreductase [Patescibacteria group bacterium]|nr:FAD-dependent oxidoreductase [Patescibacteria group bacterium]